MDPFNKQRVVFVLFLFSMTIPSLQNKLACYWARYSQEPRCFTLICLFLSSREHFKIVKYNNN